MDKKIGEITSTVQVHIHAACIIVLFTFWQYILLISALSIIFIIAFCTVGKLHF